MIPVETNRPHKVLFKGRLCVALLNPAQLLSSGFPLYLISLIILSFATPRGDEDLYLATVVEIELEGNERETPFQRLYF